PEQVPSRRSHGDGQVEHAKDAAPLILRKQVRDERGRDGDEGRLAHADQRMPNQQFPVGVGEGGEQSQSAPENRAEHDDPLARIAVGQRADKWRRDHIEPEEGAGEISHLSIGEMEFRLHQRLHGKQHRAVNVIQQVQRGQQGQRRAGIEFGRRHLAWEYNTADKSSARALPYRLTLLTLDITNAQRYHCPVIRTFANKETAEIWRTGKTRGAPPASVTKRKLAMLDGALTLDDLKVPPGNRLEKLHGNRQGQYSIRINDQYRICFEWRGPDAYDVEITDYHRG